MTNPTETMLKEIYVSAQSGCEALEAFMPKIKDRALLTSSARQLEMYSGFASRAETMMQEKSMGMPTYPLRQKLSVRGGVKMETMGHHTQQELLRMMRVASREGANRMRSAIADCSESGCTEDVLALGQRMLGFELEETELFGKMQCSESSSAHA